MELYTIGYGGFSGIEEFAAALKERGINGVIDVRSRPYSKVHTDFNREFLSEYLKNKGIAYRNYKNEFGARQLNAEYYPNGYLDFEQFSKSAEFQSGMVKVKQASENGYVLALMCSEKEPINCHRCIMVSRAFHDEGAAVTHIIAGKPDLTQTEAEDALIDEYFPQRDQLSLFEEELTRDELIKRAYRLQNEKIGYKLEEKGSDFYD